MKYIIISGNVVDGHSLCGPFDTPADAAVYASRYQPDGTWTIVKLNPPDPDAVLRDGVINYHTRADDDV